VAKRIDENPIADSRYAIADTRNDSSDLSAIGYQLSAIKYLGDGTAFVGGVPARDLSADEWAALSESERRLCLTTNLYELTGPGEPGEG
jgi:hypothetical protein